MKTDYRVICCVVAWLFCCAAVQCRKDTSDWDNLDGNRIEDFGREREGDDELSFWGKAYDASKILFNEGETVKCGEDCENTGGTCQPSPDNADVKQCKCPTDTVLADTKNKCIVGEEECAAKFPTCESIGGTCVSLKEGITCSCPEGTTFQMKENICRVNEEKCVALFPKCESTGGTCKSSKNGIKCTCPQDTTLQEETNSCTVNEGKCVALFPECESTGGTCESSKNGIKCTCPQDTTLHEETNSCTVKDEKCTEKFPECITTLGKCISSATDGIICKCPEGTLKDKDNKCIEEECGEDCTNTGGTCEGEDGNVKKCSCPTNTVLVGKTKKCKVEEGKCLTLIPACEHTGGTCVSSKDGIICSCPEGTTLQDITNICTVDEEKCLKDLPNCKKTGGSCVSSANGIMCSCPKNAKFDTTDKKCIVDETKCAEQFPNCKTTGGSCLLSSGAISCSCPEDTTFKEEAKGCIVTEEKCIGLNPNCKATGGKCVSEPKGISCNCPEGTYFQEPVQKCLVETKTCGTEWPNCVDSGGLCVSLPKGIECNCSEGLTWKEPENKCIVTDEKCKLHFPDCQTTGGTCESLAKGVQCNCPENTILTEKKCIVEEPKCTELKPTCKSSGGTCVSSQDGIKCKCPEGTAFKDSENKCIVNDTKCNLDFPGCKPTGGTCESLADGIKCNCPSDTTFLGTEKKCIVEEPKCTELHPKCNSSGGTCVSSPDGIKCKCPADTAFKDPEKECIACGCGEKSTGCQFDENKKICSCQEKFADKNGKCSNCDCGPKSTDCKFEGEKKVCSCNNGYEEKNGTCAASPCTELCGEGFDGKDGQCVTNEKKEIECKCKDTLKGFDYTHMQCKVCDCGPKSKGCLFFNDEKVCSCIKGFAEKEGKCTACECGEDATGCTFHKNGKTCECEEMHADRNGKCEKCDCGANSKGCSFEGEKKTCKCEENYADKDGKCAVDYCQIKCGCKVGGCGTETFCDGDKFKEEEVKCICNDEPVKKFDKSLKMCRTPCDDNENKCKYEAECKVQDEKVKFCDCPAGTSGDTCEDVAQCGKGGKYEQCKGDKGECKFDVGKKQAVCVCEPGKKLDDAKNYCVDEFCFEGNCKDKSKCEYDKETNTGYCVCPKEGHYYDYEANLCKTPDKCLLKKTACGENEVCVDGDCQCRPPNEKDGEKCIRTFCKSKPCFRGANCSEADGSCFCEEEKIFTGSSCEAKPCILDDDYEEKCKMCPVGMVKNGTKCVPQSGREICNTKCGYGICVNINKVDICKCFPGAQLKDKICVLMPTYCASKELLKGSHSKCNCTGIYKQAEDKKTCQLVTCQDESAKNFCALKGATCVMVWKGAKPQFDCQCPNGYIMDKNRDICTDPCSKQENIDKCLDKRQFCFNSNSEENSKTGDCRCPPPFSNAEGCTALDENIFLVSGIPVVKKNYEMKNGINQVLLNTHLIESLAQTYSSDVFDYGYLYDYEVHDKEITCSVWVRFKQNATEELKRLPFQAKKFEKGVCDDCDSDMYVWPPALPVSKKLDEVHYENLNLCSPEVKDKLCGREASCDLDKGGCSCPKGFRMLEYTRILTEDKKRIQRCEATTNGGGDLNECLLKTHNCSKNSECVKIPGDFICQCKPGFWKENNYDKNDCKDLCTKKPCVKGKCSMKKDAYNCECEPGYGGSRCDQKDVNFASAKKSTVIVGAVLGTILIVGIIAFLLYYRKIRKNSNSEDFMPAPSHSEMTERRNMRGVVNKSYE